MDEQKKTRAKAGLLALKALNEVESDYLEQAVEALEGGDAETAKFYLDLVRGLDRSGMGALLGDGVAN